MLQDHGDDQPLPLLSALSASLRVCVAKAKYNKCQFDNHSICSNMDILRKASFIFFLPMGFCTTPRHDKAPLTLEPWAARQ